MKINASILERKRKKMKLGKQAFSKWLGFQESTYSKILKSQSTTFSSIEKIADKIKVDQRKLLEY